MYDLIKHYNSNKKEINKTIEKILSKGVLEMGDEVYKFEDNFKKYCGLLLFSSSIMQKNKK